MNILLDSRDNDDKNYDGIDSKSLAQPLVISTQHNQNFDELITLTI